MHELLFDHGIWSDPHAWRDCIEMHLSAKIDDAIRRRKRKEQTEQNTGVKKLFSGKTFKTILQTKEEKQSQKFKEHQNLIFNELSRFVTYFINFSLPYEQANELLVQACDTFQLEQGKAHILCTELRSN